MRQSKRGDSSRKANKMKTREDNKQEMHIKELDAIFDRVKDSILCDGDAVDLLKKLRRKRVIKLG